MNIRISSLYLSICQDYVKRQTRFVSRQPAQVILSNIEAVAESLSLKVHTRNYKVCLVLIHLQIFYNYSSSKIIIFTFVL